MIKRQSFAVHFIGQHYRWIHRIYYVQQLSHWYVSSVDWVDELHQLHRGHLLDRYWRDLIVYLHQLPFGKVFNHSWCFGVIKLH